MDALVGHVHEDAIRSVFRKMKTFGPFKPVTKPRA